VLGSRENVYRMLDEDGYYLPSIKSRAITCSYLLKVYRNEVFRVEKSYVLTPPSEKKIWSNLDLLAYIEKKCYPKPLGFSPNTMPDRKWLLAIAYSFDKNLEVFTGILAKEEIVGLPLEALNGNKFFDPLAKKSKRPIFMKSDAQKDIEQKDKIQRRLQRKDRRKLFLQQQVRKIELEIDELIESEPEEDNEADNNEVMEDV